MKQYFLCSIVHLKENTIESGEEWMGDVRIHATQFKNKSSYKRNTIAKAV